MHFRLWYVLAGLFMGGIFASQIARAGDDVAVSIKPVHSLVAGVMAGIASPSLIIPGSASPHSYALRPSEAGYLAKARLIVWVGPQIETVLAQPIAALAGRARVLTLADEPKLTRWPLRTSGIWRNDGHGHAEHHAHGHAGDAQKRGGKRHGAVDGHIWLDPANAIVITEIVAEALMLADPGNGERYKANARHQIEQLSKLQAELTSMLAPARGKAFLVFHDSFQYMERRFDLAAAGAIAVNPERQPGPRHLAQIRKLIRSKSIACVFAEPQFPSRIADTLVEGTEARRGVLDPIGSAIPAGGGHYRELLTALANGLNGCLTGSVPARAP